MSDTSGHYPAEVLLAEDNVLIQELVRLALEGNGYRVVMVENGKLALEKLSAQTFDLVLMDCRMPVMGGLEATRVIREQGIVSRRGGPLPILALSGNSAEADIRHCLDAGMNSFLAKPFLIGELVAAVASLLSEQAVPPYLEQAALDQICALQQDGQPNILHHLIKVYLESSPVLLREMRSAIVANDAKTVEARAHALKSSSAALGATVFADFCAQLEQQTQSDNLAQAGDLITRLVEEFDRVCEAMRVIIT